MCGVTELYADSLTFVPPVDEPDDDGLHSQDGGKIVRVSTYSYYRKWSFFIIYEGAWFRLSNCRHTVGPHTGTPGMTYSVAGNTVDGTPFCGHAGELSLFRFYLWVHSTTANFLSLFPTRFRIKRFSPHKNVGVKVDSNFCAKLHLYCTYTLL